MAVELHREPGTNVLEIRVSDKLTARDYERIEHTENYAAREWLKS